MEVLCPSPNAEFLVSYVFQKAGPKRGPLFVPLLRQWAAEGREVHGKRFSLQDVEEAIKLTGAKDASQLLPVAGGRCRPDARVPTPARSAAQQCRAPGSDASPPGAATRAAAPPADAALEPTASLPKPASMGELLTHAASSEALGQEAQVGATGTEAPQEKVSLGLRGTRVEVRGNPPRLNDVVKRAAAAEGAGEPEGKRRKGPDAVAEEGRSTSSSCILLDEAAEAEEEVTVVELGLFGVPRLLQAAVVPRQTLRISAGRAAAAAGIHPFTDVGELFLEFVYQDLPDLLLRDAELAGVEIVSPMAERAKLMAKSGEMAALEATLRSAAAAAWVEGARGAQKAVGATTAAAERAGRLSAEEAEELKKMLELEINLEFGARHEDAAIDAYSRQVGQPVFGQQRRVSLSMPEGGPAEALAKALPPLRSEPMSREEAEKSEGERSGGGLSGQGGHGTGGASSASSGAYFRLTGFVDGLVDLPREQRGTMAGGHPQETLVVEVKHRIGKIRDPPNLYDVVQLCSYCRVYGLSRGHLVQCLREEFSGGPSGSSVGQLRVSHLDFSEGSPDRKGWDEHVLPALYKVAAAVYAARENEEVRLRLLAAATPEERTGLVGSLCPHLDK